MQRLLITLPALAERQNLLLATWKAARGRQQRPVVARFLATLDTRLDSLAASILAQTAPQGRMRRFTIFDPKQREITAACFADRVLHHALLNLAEPRFEAALVPSSFACRPGLGVHAAVAAVQRQLQRWPWWVQVDVAGYFPSIDHGLLMAMLARRFKGAQHLALWQRIIASGVSAGPQGAGPGVGLPIGALTSQHLANAYLDAADRFLLDLPEVGGHVRYMDDIVWWCRSRAEAENTLALLADFLWQARRLRLKPSAQVGESRHGLRFCGFDVRQGAVWPGPRKRQRFAQGAERLAAAASVQPPGPGWQRAHDALHATLAHTHSRGLRQRVWARQAGLHDAADDPAPPG